MSGVISVLRTISQILTAGVAITAFSLLLYALVFNLRERVARSFVIVLLCVVIIYSAEAVGSTMEQIWEMEVFMHIQWAGIILLPPAYLHFSDALLVTTGKNGRHWRIWIIRGVYVVSALFFISLPFGLLGPLSEDILPAPHLTSTALTGIFTIFYGVTMLMAWVNLITAYRRMITPTGKRRMAYLLAGAAAPAIGAFPYLTFGSAFFPEQPVVFWLMAIVTNALTGVLIGVMAYSVAFYGVSWPDRVIKSRLFRWLMRGPFTASIALAVVTVVRRTGAIFGLPYNAAVPILMVITILVIEYALMLSMPLWERWLFYGKDQRELILLRSLEDRLLTGRDLWQFLEAAVAALCDRFQSHEAFLIEFTESGTEMTYGVGVEDFTRDESSVAELAAAVDGEAESGLLNWRGYSLLPLKVEGTLLLGVLGFRRNITVDMDTEHYRALRLLGRRLSIALRDRRIEKQVFDSLQTLQPQVSMVQQMRATSRAEQTEGLMGEEIAPPDEFTGWVKDALTHYWGGPRLTESPLLELQVIKERLPEHDGIAANALRSLLREAIEQVRPEGERRFTGEWILYNILDMKFLEGKKVREIARRLSVSEADLYRKQRVAIEAVAKAVIAMEQKALLENHRAI